MDRTRLATAALLSTLIVITWLHATVQTDERPQKQEDVACIEQLIAQNAP